MRTLVIVWAASSLVLGGCASQLKVYGDQSGQRAIAGVPIHTPELYIKTGTYTKLAKGGHCERVPFAETELLPLGPTYYVNVDAAEFAKTGFSVKYGDNGNVSEITMNSEPSTDAFKNAAELIGTLAPIAGIGPAAAAAAAASPVPPCDAVPDPASIQYRRFTP